MSLGEQVTRAQPKTSPEYASRCRTVGWQMLNWGVKNFKSDNFLTGE